MMTPDFHTIVDACVIAFSAFQAWQHAQMRIQILELKNWIHENFERLPADKRGGS